MNCPPRNIVVHFPSLRSVVALLISRSFGLPPPATGSGRPLLPRHRGAMGSILISATKKDYPSIVSFLRRWRDLNCPPRNIVAHFPSLRSVVALLISRSFGLPPPATGSGRPLLPRHRGASGSILQNKKDYPSIVSFLRRWRDLNPRATLMTYTLSRGTSSAS